MRLTVDTTVLAEKDFASTDDDHELCTVDIGGIDLHIRHGSNKCILRVALDQVDAQPESAMSWLSVELMDKCTR